MLEPVCGSGGVPTRVGAAGGTAGENSLTAILNQYSTRQEVTINFGSLKSKVFDIFNDNSNNHFRT